jgi:hypothetical protein
MIHLNSLKYLAPHANTDDNSTHEYVNIEIVNEYSTLNTLPKQLIFDQVKTCNVVDISSDYFLSIVRWNIQSNLPVLIPEMVSATNTKYILTMAYDTYDQGTITLNVLPGSNVLFTPEDYSATPATGFPTRDVIMADPYYYLKYVDSFLRMINLTIIKVITDAGGTWAHPDFFQWDSVSQKIVYNRGVTPPTVPNPTTPGLPPIPAQSGWQLCINQALYNLLNTFRFNIFSAFTPTTFNDPTLSKCYYQMNTSIVDNTDSAVGDYIKFVQQSSSVVNWSPVSSIVFTSGTIPIEPQLSGAPDNLNTVNPLTSSNIYQQNGTTKVLTDFCIPFSSGVEATNQQIYYIPTSEYRLIDMLGNQNLNELTIQVFWRDKYGGLHPMTLDAGAAANMLILLRKKSFNNQKTI